jgi:hypothetical protein
MRQPIEISETSMSINLHFNIEVDMERRLVISKIYGIWKRENALAYVAEYKKAATPLLDGKWARLINLCNWKSSYPEIIEIINEHVRWGYNNGAEYLAYVIDNPVLMKTLKKMTKVGKTANPTRMFKTYEEADRFLRSKGY